jgi:hypothetical protein
LDEDAGSNLSVGGMDSTRRLAGWISSAGGSAKVDWQCEARKENSKKFGGRFGSRRGGSKKITKSAIEIERNRIAKPPLGQTAAIARKSTFVFH